MRIRVHLTNRLARFVAPYPEKQLADIFSYTVPGAYFNPLYRNRMWDGKKSFLKYSTVPAGLFLEMKDKIEKEWDVKFKVRDIRERPRFRKIEDSDRQFQNKCVKAMKRNSYTGGIILVATRLGKTRIAGMFFKSLKGKGVFVVDELTLLEQARKAIQKVIGEKVGSIGKMEFKPRRISVATIQTLFKHRNDPKFESWKDSLDVMFIDEVHSMLSKRNNDIVANIQPKTVFGLTATLQTQKKHIRMKATALAGPVIFKYTVKKGVKNKYLVPGVVIGVDLVKPGRKDLDYWSDYNHTVMKSKRRNRIITSLTREALVRNKSILTLVERVPHIRILSNKLKDIPHKLAYGGIKVKDRLRAQSKFDKDKLRLIIANKVFAKGITLARITVAIDATGLPGQNAAQQKYGRGIGLCDNKTGLIYFDIGFVNPSGVTPRSFSYNRFAKATRSRRKALTRLGVPVYNITWNGSASDVMDFAERKLRKEIAKHA